MIRYWPALLSVLLSLGAIVGYVAFDATLSASQWAGLALTTMVVLLLPVRGRKIVDVEPVGLAPAQA